MYDLIKKGYGGNAYDQGKSVKQESAFKRFTRMLKDYFVNESLENSLKQSIDLFDEVFETNNHVLDTLERLVEKKQSNVSVNFRYVDISDLNFEFDKLDLNKYSND
jgi:hypothetical protein